MAGNLDATDSVMSLLTLWGGGSTFDVIPAENNVTLIIADDSNAHIDLGRNRYVGIAAEPGQYHYSQAPPTQHPHSGYTSWTHTDPEPGGDIWAIDHYGFSENALFKYVDGAGRNGGAVLEVTMQDLEGVGDNAGATDIGLVGFFVVRKASGGGFPADSGLHNVCPPWKRANQIEFWIKYPANYRTTNPWGGSNDRSFTLGQYMGDGAVDASSQETNNYHPYSEPTYRHDTNTSAEWEHVVIRQHNVMRGDQTNRTIPNSVWGQIGGPFETLRRFYFQDSPQYTDPTPVGFPHTVQIEDVRLTYVKRDTGLSISWDRFINSHGVRGEFSATATMQISQGETKTFTYAIANSTGSDINALHNYAAFSNNHLSLKAFDSSGVTASDGASITIAAQSTSRYTLRVTGGSNSGWYDIGRYCSVYLVPTSEDASNNSVNNPTYVETRYGGNNEGMIDGELPSCALWFYHMGTGSSADTYAPDSPGGRKALLAANGDSIVIPLRSKEPQSASMSISITTAPSFGTLSNTSHATQEITYTRDSSASANPGEAQGYDFFEYQIKSVNGTSPTRVAYCSPGTVTALLN